MKYTVSFVCALNEAYNIWLIDALSVEDIPYENIADVVTQESEIARRFVNVGADENTSHDWQRNN